MKSAVTLSTAPALLRSNVIHVVVNLLVYNHVYGLDPNVLDALVCVHHCSNENEMVSIYMLFTEKPVGVQYVERYKNIEREVTNTTGQSVRSRRQKPFTVDSDPSTTQPQHSTPPSTLATSRASQGDLQVATAPA